MASHGWCWRGWALGVLVALAAGCDSDGAGPLLGPGDAAVIGDAMGSAIGRDAAADLGMDAFADAPSTDGAVDVSVPFDGAADTGGDAVGAGPDLAAPDLAQACSPEPDQRGFFAGCAACPDPSDCDTIDVGGSPSFACGCNSPCPCGLHCGSFVIPGIGISISGICVR